MNRSEPTLRSIRVANEEDAAAIAELSRNLLEFEKSLNGGMGQLNPWAGGVEEILKQMMRPDTLFLVAVINGEIGGYIKTIIVGHQLGPAELGFARWLLGLVESGGRRIFNFLLRRPRPSVVLSGGYISGIFVRAEHRRSNTGHLLVKAAEDWFRQHDIATADLHVLFANSAAREFWEELGYQPVSLGMQKKI